MCQKGQTLTRRGVGDAAAGLGLYFLPMFEGPFSHDAGQMVKPDAPLFITQAMESFNTNKESYDKYHI